MSSPHNFILDFSANSNFYPTFDLANTTDMSLRMTMRLVDSSIAPQVQCAASEIYSSLGSSQSSTLVSSIINHFTDDFFQLTLLSQMNDGSSINYISLGTEYNTIINTAISSFSRAIASCSIESLPTLNPDDVLTINVRILYTALKYITATYHIKAMSG